MTDAELVALGDRNYVEAWRLLAEVGNDGAWHEDDGLLMTATGGNIIWLNIAFVTRPLADPRAQLKGTFDFYRRHERPFLVRVREGLDPASEQALEQLGFRYTDTLPGMAWQPIQRGERPPLEVRDADAQSWHEYVDIIADSFEIPRDEARRMMPPELLRAPDTGWYLGFVESRAVATSALLVTDSTAGVHYVATAGGYRGRGFGEAMTRHAALAGAARGATFANLQASPMGMPVYERMGFRTIAGYKTFVPGEQ